MPKALVSQRLEMMLRGFGLAPKAVDVSIGRSLMRAPLAISREHFDEERVAVGCMVAKSL
jgi:hypothetical protein